MPLKFLSVLAPRSTFTRERPDDRASSHPDTVLIVLTSSILTMHDPSADYKTAAREHEHPAFPSIFPFPVHSRPPRSLPPRHHTFAYRFYQHSTR